MRLKNGEKNTRSRTSTSPGTVRTSSGRFQGFRRNGFVFERGASSGRGGSKSPRTSHGRRASHARIKHRASREPSQENHPISSNLPVRSLPLHALLRVQFGVWVPVLRPSCIGHCEPVANVCKFSSDALRQESFRAVRLRVRVVLISPFACATCRLTSWRCQSVWQNVRGRH